MKPFIMLLHPKSLNISFSTCFFCFVFVLFFWHSVRGDCGFLVCSVLLYVNIYKKEKRFIATQYCKFSLGYVDQLVKCLVITLARHQYCRPLLDTNIVLKYFVSFYDFSWSSEVYQDLGRLWYYHCVKSVRIWSYSGPHFSSFGLNTESYGVILVLIFLHSDWIRRDTPHLSLFSPNAGKCVPK